MKLFKENITPRLSTLGDKIYPLVVDIKKGVKSGDAVNFVTADNEVGILSIELVNGDEPYDISGCIVCGTIQRPDTSTLNVYCDIVGANKLEIPLGVSGTYQEGVHNFDLKIYRGNEKVIGVPTMSYTVTGSLSSDGVAEGDDRLPVLTTVLDNAQDKLTRLDKAIAGATNDLEVKEARDGEVTLNARLERDLEKGKIHFVDVEGSNVSIESEEGYLENIEILGNTWQDSENLADIRSVGTKVEGQELYEIPVLSTGKNLLNINSLGTYYGVTFSFEKNVLSVKGTGTVSILKKYSIKHLVEEGRTYVLTSKSKNSNVGIIDGSSVTSIGGAFVAGNDVCIYFQIREGVVINETIELQLEEGTQDTPYEPYQEDKLTILSPVQLEKVGDVADRIICKDGVWGVEKNVVDIILNGSEGWRRSTATENFIDFRFTHIEDTVRSNKAVVCDKFEGKSNIKGSWICNENGITILNGTPELLLTINKTRLTSFDIQGLKTWLQANNVLVKYITKQPQFIPLPHDQQVKLRTFANKTHISFETEIEPTLKASVPKSLGATVNTHTTQIDSLNKELDRVKKLEESTVSTVTSYKSFTSVAETTQGYFEDVKIEGKTLVNLCSNFRVVNMHSYQSYIELEVAPNTKYTVIVPIYANHVYGIFSSDGKKTILDYRLASVCNIFNFTSNDDTNFRLYCRLYDEQGSLALKGELNKNACDVILLEGDHTDKDISFFEGLKSVGQDSDEISVSSVNENTWDGKFILNEGLDGNNGGTYISQNRCRTDFIPVKPNTKYYLINCDTLVWGAYDKTKKFISNIGSTRITPQNCKYLRISIDSTVDFSNALFGIYGETELLPHQSDKKQILYYNPNTETWEKPVLREWDSIEKHDDGKYYYHKRSSEVVLNGSEDWKLPVGEQWNNKASTCAFVINIKGAKGCTWGKYTPRELSSKFSNYGDIELYNSDIEGFTTDNEQGDRVFRVLRTKLSTQDVAGFKQWLQANPVTVVYQLAKEEVYECTNLDLITYIGETNLIVSSGAIQPRITLKVLSNVSNVVKLLQEKVSILENKFIKGLQQVLAGDMMSLAHLLYPEDFENNHEIQTLEL